MNRSQLSSLAVITILIVAAASCVYRSSRDSEPSSAPTSSANKNDTLTKKFDEDKKSDKGDFIVEYLKIKNSRYDEIDRQLKKVKLLEKAADKLNRSLILPYDIYLKTKDCGEVNAFYDSDEHSVTVCFELMEHFYKVFWLGSRANRPTGRWLLAKSIRAFLRRLVRCPFRPPKKP